MYVAQLIDQAREVAAEGVAQLSRPAMAGVPLPDYRAAATVTPR